jgi:hypothetical protein
VEQQDEAVEPGWWSYFAMGVCIGMVVLAIVGVVFVVLTTRGFTYEPSDSASSVCCAPGP